MMFRYMLVVTSMLQRRRGHLSISLPDSLLIRRRYAHPWTRRQRGRKPKLGNSISPHLIQSISYLKDDQIDVPTKGADRQFACSNRSCCRKVETIHKQLDSIISNRPIQWIIEVEMLYFLSTLFSMSSALSPSLAKLGETLVTNKTHSYILAQLNTVHHDTVASPGTLPDVSHVRFAYCSAGSILPISQTQLVWTIDLEVFQKIRSAFSTKLGQNESWRRRIIYKAFTGQQYL